MNRRALTPVLGFVLLVGITGVAAVSLLFVGTALTDSTQSQVQSEQAGQSFSEFADVANSLATGEIDRGDFSIRGAEDARVRADPDTGDTIRIRVANSTDGEGEHLLDVTRDLGALVYTADDGTEIAYQGGGVWQKNDDGPATMVHPPEFHYREEPDPTITFPMILVEDEFDDSATVTGSMVDRGSNDLYPDEPIHYNPLMDGSVLIEIDSEYCEGWEQYFRQRTDGSAAEACDAGNEGQLRIEFSVPFEIDGLGSGVMIGDGGADPDDFDGIDDADDFGDATDATSATPLVESRLEEARDSGEVLPDEPVIDEPGLYYDDGNLTSGPVTFDTSAGDIRIATDRNPVFDGGLDDLDVTGDNNVSIFTTGNLVDKGMGDTEIGTDGESEHLRVFVHSDVETVGAKGQNTDFHGLLYAPNSDVVLFRGNNEASGAIVADSVDMGNPTTFEINERLAALTLFEEIGDAPFYYLHISETTLGFEDE